MRSIRLIPIIIGLLLSFGIRISTCEAQASSAYDVIAAVNDFRRAHGLPPLQTNAVLMSIAQAHSDYQASIGTVTHNGPGGSDPKDRAYAAGFGSGATIFLSENIAGGLNLSIQNAISQYWQDEAHLYTMLNPAAVYIGAGVGISGDYVYYTVDAGYYAGAPSLSSANNPSTTGSIPNQPAVIYDPFVVSTPNNDSSIIHVVGYGQTLIGIANTYEVELNNILLLNNLTLDSFIYPGDEIVIREGSTPTTTPTITITQPTITASQTATKTTPTPRDTFTDVPTSSSTPSSTPSPISAERENLVIGVVLMAAAVFIVVIITGVMTRKSTKHRDS